MDTDTSPNPRYAVPAVDQMLDLVEHMAQSDRPWKLSELARTLGLSLNTAFRILKRLVARRYVEVDMATGGYQLSSRFFTLGMQLHARFDLRRRARPHLEGLSQATGETTQIYTLQDSHALVLDCIPPPASSFIQVIPGSLMLLHASAFSKAILAFKGQEDVRRRIGRRMEALTPNTHTDFKALLKELDRVRETGLAYDREEYTLGIYCVGAPVFDASGQVVAGAGVTGLVSRFHRENLPIVERRVLDCVERISLDIGYPGNRFLVFKEAWRARPKGSEPVEEREGAGLVERGKGHG